MHKIGFKRYAKNDICISATDDVGEFTTELVEKMEQFKIVDEKVSALKTLAIKLEVSSKV